MSRVVASVWSTTWLPLVWFVSQLTDSQSVRGLSWARLRSWRGDWRTGLRRRTPPSEALCLASEHRALVEEVRVEMAADTPSDALLKSLKLARWVLALQRKGYKLAMVKDGHVQAVQLF
jgi:hypothetical protein